MPTARRLATILVVAAGCGGTSTPPPPQPPRVTISPIAREIVGVSFDLTLEIQGCKTVSRVWATEHDDILAQQAGGDIGTRLTVPANKVPYKRLGVPASLSIVAHATCDTGLTGDSDPQATTFLPASEVLPGAWPMGQNFWVDQDASTVLTCDQRMRRLGKDKVELAGFSLPFDCAGDAELTFGADGNRYLLKPGVGVVGFTSGLSEFMSFTDFPALQLAVPPQGALAVLGMDGVSYQVRGYDRTSGQVLWAATDTDAQPAGHLMVNSLGEIVYPGFKQQTGSDFVDVGIELYDAKTGGRVADRPFGKIKVDILSVTPIPTISFDQTGSVAYFAEIANPSQVWACSATDDLTCTDLGGGLKWKSTPLPGGVTTVTRTANALVAFGDKVAYFLDPTTGAALTPTSTPIATQAGLVFVAAVGGSDGSTYLLAMAREASSGHLLRGIKEILIFDRPDKKVVDYYSGTNGYIVDVDTNGRGWLWKFDLTPLMLPADYRAALGN